MNFFELPTQAVCFFLFQNFNCVYFFLVVVGRFIIIILLKDNCFTEFCCFLSNININQPQVYIYPFPFNLPPTSLPIPPLQIDTEPLFEFPEPYSKFPLAIYFTYDNISFHVTLSIHLTLSSPLPMSINLFSMSVSPFLPCKINSSVSFFQIPYMRVRI